MTPIYGTVDSSTLCSSTKRGGAWRILVRATKVSSGLKREQSTAGVRDGLSIVRVRNTTCRRPSWTETFSSTLGSEKRPNRLSGPFERLPQPDPLRTLLITSTLGRAYDIPSSVKCYHLVAPVWPYGSSKNSSSTIQSGAHLKFGLLSRHIHTLAAPNRRRLPRSGYVMPAGRDLD